MAFIFDLLLLSFLLLVVVFDTKKGFLRASVGFARILIALLIAVLLSGFLATVIDRLWMYPAVHSAIQNVLEPNGVIEGAAIVSSIPLGLRAIAALGGIDLRAIADSSVTTELSEALARPIAHCISATVSFLFLLIVSYFALKLLVPLLSKAIRTCSLLKAADTVGGLLFGIFHAFLLGWAVSFAAGFILSLFGSSLDETYVIRFFNHASPIKTILWIFLR